MKNRISSGGCIVIYFTVVVMVTMLLMKIMTLENNSNTEQNELVEETTNSKSVTMENMFETSNTTETMANILEFETLGLRGMEVGINKTVDEPLNIVTYETEKDIINIEENDIEENDIEENNTEEVIIDSNKDIEINTLRSIHNKLVEVYKAEEWVKEPSELAEDEFGYNMGISTDLYKTFVCQYSIDKNNLNMFLAVYAKDGKSSKIEDKLRNYVNQFNNKNSIEIMTINNNYVYLLALNDNSKAKEVLSVEENYFNVGSEIKLDKRYVMEYDGTYKINIPDIKSKPQSIESESEEQLESESLEYIEG